MEAMMIFPSLNLGFLTRVDDAPYPGKSFDFPHHAQGGGVQKVTKFSAKGARYSQEHNRYEVTLHDPHVTLLEVKQFIPRTARSRPEGGAAFCSLSSFPDFSAAEFPFGTLRFF